LEPNVGRVTWGGEVAPKSGQPGPERAVMLKFQLQGRMRRAEVSLGVGLGRARAVPTRAARIWRGDGIVLLRGVDLWEQEVGFS